jgi:hypothetical protein
MRIIFCDFSFFFFFIAPGVGVHSDAMVSGGGEKKKGKGGPLTTEVEGGGPLAGAEADPKESGLAATLKGYLPRFFESDVPREENKFKATLATAIPQVRSLSPSCSSPSHPCSVSLPLGVPRRRRGRRVSPPERSCDEPTQYTPCTFLCTPIREFPFILASGAA